MSEGAGSHRADDKQTESARMDVFEEESLKASHLLMEKLHKSEKLDEVHRSSAEMDATSRSQDNCIQMMERENRALKAQDETINRETSTVSSESEKNKGKIADLTNALQALQQQLDECRFSLEKSNQELHEKSMIIKQMESSTKEYITIIKELRSRNKDLKAQLEKAVMFGGPKVEQPIAAEREQLPHSNVEFSDVEEAVEKEQEQELHIEEKEGPVVDAQNQSWLRRQAKRLWKGLKRVGSFCLGVVLSLGVLACMGPSFDLHTIHPGNRDIMGTWAHHLMHPYCTCHNFGMRPV